MSFLISNKIPTYAGMTAFLNFRLLLGFCKGFSLKRAGARKTVRVGWHGFLFGGDMGWGGMAFQAAFGCRGSLKFKMERRRLVAKWIFNTVLLVGKMSGEPPMLHRL